MTIYLCTCIIVSPELMYTGFYCLCLGHMELPGSLRAPYGPKFQWPVGDRTAYRVGPHRVVRVFSARIDPYTRKQPVSESCACTYFFPRRRHIGNRTGPITRMCTHGHHRDPHGPRTMIVEFYGCSQARTGSVRCSHMYRTDPHMQHTVTVRVLATPSPKHRNETVEIP